jgi:tetratricopeptide (TPR) repeat protein
LEPRSEPASPLPQPLPSPPLTPPLPPSLLKRVFQRFALLLSDPWAWALALCFALLFLFAARKNFDFDLGFHLASGRWILQHLDVPQADAFTFGAAGHEWLDSQWLYQVAVLLLDRLGGYPLVSLCHLALILLAFSLTSLRLFLGGCPRWLQVALVLPAILAMEIRFLARPEVLSWVFLAAVFLSLDLYRKGRREGLFLLPVIHLLWANVEGLFPLGWAVMAAYLLTGFLETRRPDPALLKSFLASVAATLVNPYGFKVLAFPLLLLTRLDPSGFFRKAVSELQSPWTASAVPDSPFFPDLPVVTYRILSVLLVLLVLATLRRRKFHEPVLAVFFFALSALAIRNVPLFFIAVLPTAAKAAGELLSFKVAGEGGGWTHGSPPRWLGKAAAAFILLLALRVATGAYYVSDRRIIHNGWGMDREHLPIRAGEFLAANHIQDPLMNNMAFGGFLEWETQAPVFIDGRLEVMGEDLFKLYFQSYGAGGLETLAQQTRFQMVVYDHMADIPWTKQLMAMPKWRMVYLDDLSAIWAAPYEAPTLPTVSPRDLEKDWGIGPWDEDKTLEAIQSKPRSSLADWLDGFVFPQRYPMPCMRLGSLAYEMGDYATARDFFLRALVLSDGRYYEIYYNLAAAYTKLGLKTKARSCYMSVLALYPSCPGVMAQLAGLNS